MPTLRLRCYTGWAKRLENNENVSGCAVWCADTCWSDMEAAVEAVSYRTAAHCLETCHAVPHCTALRCTAVCRWATTRQLVSGTGPPSLCLRCLLRSLTGAPSRHACLIRLQHQPWLVGGICPGTQRLRHPGIPFDNDLALPDHCTRR